MKFRHILTACLLFSIAFTSCEDDEDDATTPATTTPTTPTNAGPTGPPTLSFDGADGTLIAIKSSSSTIAGTIDIGTAVAVFLDNGNLVDVGTITAEGEDLNKNANNSYTFTPGLLNPTGITFSTPIEWTVTGGNGYAAITSSNNNSFPTVGTMSANSTVSKTQDYTVSVNNVLDADSILYTLGSVSHTTAGNVLSHTFKSSEISGLSGGTSFVSVAPYNIKKETHGSKEIYFVNETVKQQTVTVQ